MVVVPGDRARASVPDGNNCRAQAAENAGDTVHRPVFVADGEVVRGDWQGQGRHERRSEETGAESVAVGRIVRPDGSHELKAGGREPRAEGGKPRADEGGGRTRQAVRVFGASEKDKHRNQRRAADDCYNFTVSGVGSFGLGFAVSSSFFVLFRYCCSLFIC